MQREVIPQEAHVMVSSTSHSTCPTTTTLQSADEYVGTFQPETYVGKDVSDYQPSLHVSVSTSYQSRVPVGHHRAHSYQPPPPPPDELSPQTSIDRDVLQSDETGPKFAMASEEPEAVDESSVYDDNAWVEGQAWVQGQNIGHSQSIQSSKVTKSTRLVCFFVAFI